MIPNMFKIAGELTPTVIHVAARTVATHALSIFGDHSDVMACRATGWALLASNSVQEAMDFALVAHAATLRSRIPFLHFFDGFRTSHEVNEDRGALRRRTCARMIDDDWYRAHRARALSPEHPVIRGTAQNPDVFFQAREAANPFYMACPAIVQAAMDRLGAHGSAASITCSITSALPTPTRHRHDGIGRRGRGGNRATSVARGEKVGLVKVRLYRPFSVEQFIGALPATVERIAVLDRTKEPGAIGEPLYLDVVAALAGGIADGLGQLDRRARRSSAAATASRRRSSRRRW